MQMLALLFVSVVVLVGLLLPAEAQDPIQKRVLIIYSLVLIPVLPVLGIRLMKRYRRYLLDDRLFADLLKREEEFKAFKTEGTETEGTAVRENRNGPDGEKERQNTYTRNKGLFLVHRFHRWTPSKYGGQVADVVIQVVGHWDTAVTRAAVKEVKYFLGPNFFRGVPPVKKDSTGAFRLSISAYKPLLCRAEVSLESGDVIVLERYIDFG